MSSQPANLRMILDNAGDSATLSADPVLVSTLPVGNLQLQEGAKVARSTSAATQYIHFDMTRSRVIDSDMFVLLGDFSNSATVKITLYSGAGQTGDEVYSSEPELVWKPIPWEEFAWGTYEWGGGAIYDKTNATPASTISPADNGELYLSGTFEIIDHDNENGYHNLHRLFIGQKLTPSVNFGYGYAIELRDTSQQHRDAGGGLVTFPTEPYRATRFTLEHMTRQEFSAFWTGLSVCGKVKDIYLDMLPDSSGIEQAAHAMRGKFIKIPTFAQSYDGNYGADFEIEETK